MKGHTGDTIIAIVLITIAILALLGLLWDTRQRSEKPLRFRMRPRKTQKQREWSQDRSPHFDNTGRIFFYGIDGHLFEKPKAGTQRYSPYFEEMIETVTFVNDFEWSFRFVTPRRPTMHGVFAAHSRFSQLPKNAPVRIGINKRAAYDPKTDPYREQLIKRSEQ